MFSAKSGKSIGRARPFRKAAPHRFPFSLELLRTEDRSYSVRRVDYIRTGFRPRTVSKLSLFSGV